MKRVVLPKPKFALGIFLSSLLMVVGMSPAQAAVLFTTDNSTCSSYGHGNLRVEDSPLTVPGAATITSIDLRVASLSGQASAQMRIYADNSDNPGTLLGTFTYSSINGLLATYVGSASLSSAGKYWIRYSTTSSFTPCYNFNPVTTGSLSGWSIGKMRESVDSGTNFTTRTDNLSFFIVLNGTGGAAINNSSISISSNMLATYRQSEAITATLGIAGTDGKVTFYANGKKIPGCINKLSASLSVICNWKPSLRGSTTLTARLVPTNTGYSPSSSTAQVVLIGNRSTKR